LGLIAWKKTLLYGASFYVALDMAGNVSEFNSDYYSGTIKVVITGGGSGSWGYFLKSSNKENIRHS
jgi:hypothetical protein